MDNVKICFRCKKTIKNQDHYMRFTEFYEGKDVKSDYTHKKCWDDFLKSITDITEAQGVLRNLKGTLTKMGMLPQEEYVVE